MAAQSFFSRESCHSGCRASWKVFISGTANSWSSPPSPSSWCSPSGIGEATGSPVSGAGDSSGAGEVTGVALAVAGFCCCRHAP